MFRLSFKRGKGSRSVERLGSLGALVTLYLFTLPIAAWADTLFSETLINSLGSFS